MNDLKSTMLVAAALVAALAPTPLPDLAVCLIAGGVALAPFLVRVWQ